jgi:pilus assembly protein Flp/PilA
MVRALSRLYSDQSGATLVEYGIVVGLISVAVVGGARTLGISISATFNTISAALLGG